jgi:N-acetylneuraminic acid mutarotase
MVSSSCTDSALLNVPVLNFILQFLPPQSLGAVAIVCRRLSGESEDAAKFIIKSLSHILTPQAALGGYHCHGAISHAHHLYRMTKRRIVLIGGGNMDEGHESYKRSDHLDVATGEWSVCTSMTNRRGTFKTEAVALGGLVVVVSGDDDDAVGTLEAYDPLTDTWEDLPPLPQRLMLVAAASEGKKLYISGGIDKATGQYSDAVFCLNKAGNPGEEWTTLKSKLLSPRVGHASASINGALWIAGGQFADSDNGSSSASSVEVYDLESQKWVKGPSMIAERIWFRLLVIQDTLYAIGGDVDSKGSSLTPTIERLNNRQNVWEKVADFTKVRRVFSTSSVGSKIYIFGGRDINYGTLQDWDCFDVKTNKWESACYGDMTDVEKNTNSKAIGHIRSPEKRKIPRLKFYGGQSVSLPAEEITW